MPEASKHLRGPWKAFLVTDDGGQVFPSLGAVPDGIDVAVAVLRGNTLTLALGGTIPDDYDPDDLDVLYTVTPDLAKDWSSELLVRWEQAVAIAQALNALAGQSSNEPGA
jgi:hypothetical protein